MCVYVCVCVCVRMIPDRTTRLARTTGCARHALPSTQQLPEKNSKGSAKTGGRRRRGGGGRRRREGWALKRSTRGACVCVCAKKVTGTYHTGVERVFHSPDPKYKGVKRNRKREHLVITLAGATRHLCASRLLDRRQRETETERQTHTHIHRERERYIDS